MKNKFRSQASCQLTEWKLIFAVTTALTCSMTSAQNIVQTFGSIDCGKWLQAKTPVDQAWLLGYMTGLNIQLNDNPLGKINSSFQIVSWMNNYCQKNPLENVLNGGVELLNELKKK